MSNDGIRHWVLLRGLSREREHWGRFGRRCHQELGWQCTFLDLPGFGDQHKLTSPPTIAEIRQQVAQRLDAPSDSALGLIALSLGGMVALDWLAAEPQRFQAAVLINSSSRLSPWYQRLQPDQLWRVLTALGSGNIEKQERAILKMVSNRYPELGEETLSRWIAIRQRHPITKANTLRQLFAASRFRPPATLPLSPLFIASYSDRMVSWKCSARLAQRYGGELMAHPRAGHDLPLDDGDWLIERLKKRFVEQLR